MIFDEPHCKNCGGPHMIFHCQPMNQNFYNSNSSGFDQNQPPQSPAIHQPPQEMSIQEMEDLKQQYFDKMKRLINSKYRDEIKIDELKGNFNSMSIEINKKEKLLQLEQLANLSTYPSKHLNSFCYDDDDDEDYTIAVTPVLSTEEPNNSLSMGDEHLDTIPATKSEEVIKSNVKDLISILSESEAIPDTIDDDYLYNENIEYVEASPHDYELVSLEVAKIVIPEDEEIEDDNLREKLLKVNLLIAKIETLKDNPTPSSEFLTKSSSTSSKSFLEKTNTFDDSLPELENFCFDLEAISSVNTTTHSDISLPNYEAFSFYDDHIEEISSGSTTTHSNISLFEYDSFIFDLLNDQFLPTDRSDFTHEEFDDELAHIISPPEYDCFLFKVEPNSRDFTKDVVEDISPTKEPQVHNALPTHPNLQLNMKFQPSSEYLFTYVVWIFLPFLVYSVAPHYHLSLRNEDTIFDLGICNSYFSRLDISHRCGTFPRFNVLPESPMEIFSSTCSSMDK
nr:hypothetical protein [Tanacetum cinerariifolium]